MPVRILTSVDLPAPFSPTSAVVSPARSVRPTSCKARTPGKDLLTPDSDSTGAAGSMVRMGEFWVTAAGRRSHEKKGASARRDGGAMRQSEHLGEFLDVRLVED